MHLSSSSHTRTHNTAQLPALLTTSTHVRALAKTKKQNTGTNPETKKTTGIRTPVVLSALPEAVGPEPERRCRAGRVYTLRARARKKSTLTVYTPGQESGREGRPRGADNGVQGARHRDGPARGGKAT